MMPTLREITAKRDKPILLIANGSGIAPMRPIWQMKKNDPDALGDIIFLYGCRKRCNMRFCQLVNIAYLSCPKHRNRIQSASNTLSTYSSSDNLFDEECKDIVDRKVAYSREVLSPKVYVQDLVRQHAKLIWNSVFIKGGSIMVCGKVLILGLTNLISLTSLFS